MGGWGRGGSCCKWVTSRVAEIVASGAAAVVSVVVAAAAAVVAAIAAAVVAVATGLQHAWCTVGFIASGGAATDASIPAAA